MGLSGLAGLVPQRQHGWVLTHQDMRRKGPGVRSCSECIGVTPESTDIKKKNQSFTGAMMPSFSGSSERLQRDAQVRVMQLGILIERIERLCDA